MVTRNRLINRRYRLERRTSVTDTTETWLGFDNVLHRAVSVTVPRQELLRDGSFLVQFLQRSRIATALHHRGIIAAFDSGEDGDTPYLVTEYLGGDSLGEIIRAESPFDVDDVAVLVAQLANALDYAHQRGFAHGSLTPENVIVDSQGAAKVLGLGLPIGTDIPGRPSPLSIEEDIAALAAIAFTMLTGEDRDSVEPDAGAEAYLIDPDVPRNASDIVAIGLGAGPIRFNTAGVFARTLSSWRKFDPGEFFVAASPPPAPDGLRVATSPGAGLGLAVAPLALNSASEADVALEPADTGVPRRRANRWAWLGVMLLAIAAVGVAWWSGDAPTPPEATVPYQIAQLARSIGV